jgi:ergothioneine biosynthesis protein EgtB
MTMPALSASAWGRRFFEVRDRTRRLAEPLTAEDQMLQSMPDASPTKWHLAHTTWFFETFLLMPHVQGYQPFHPRFGFLFNSYYNAMGERHPRPQRGLLSRPSVEEVLAYREAVDAQVLSLCSGSAHSPDFFRVLELGLNHEQQHQELLLTDIKHAFSCNVLAPAYTQPAEVGSPALAPPMRWVAFEPGVESIGHHSDSFSFDNELPRHRTFLEGYELASRLVTCGEYLEFMLDGGYQKPELWLSEGWDARCREGWRAPLYWEERDKEWWQYTLSGMRQIVPSEPVCHVSYYEADAYAHWAKARLPTEAQWEVAAQRQRVSGNFADNGRFHPACAGDLPKLAQLFGDTWEWTQSSYLPYPGYQPDAGALGEYNGKFMVGQMVLRGGSCATPQSHIRASYRNYFPPSARWQFSGIRLARAV